MTKTKNRSCGGKKVYPTLRRAQDAARALARNKGPAKSGFFHGYKCKFCGGHHVGRLSRRRR